VESIESKLLLQSFSSGGHICATGLEMREVKLYIDVV